MIIYVGHSRDFDYQNELYAPIRKSIINELYKIILPHETSDEPFKSKEILPICNAMIAEVSLPSTGLGIELGWANYLGCNIICIYKQRKPISNSLQLISDIFIEYSDGEELVKKLQSSLIPLNRTP